MRVIDADATVNALFYRARQAHKRNGGTYDNVATLIYKEAAELVDKMPTVFTIDPVKRGEWLRHENMDKLWFRCSVCRDVYFLPKKYNFCPNCGADMRGENNG